MSQGLLTSQPKQADFIPAVHASWSFGLPVELPLVDMSCLAMPADSLEASSRALSCLLDTVPAVSPLKEGIAPFVLGVNKVKHAAWIGDFGATSLPLLAALLTTKSLVVVVPVLPSVRQVIGADFVGRSFCLFDTMSYTMHEYSCAGMALLKDGSVMSNLMQTYKDGMAGMWMLPIDEQAVQDEFGRPRHWAKLGAVLKSAAGFKGRLTWVQIQDNRVMVLRHGLASAWLPKTVVSEGGFMVKSFQ